MLKIKFRREDGREDEYLTATTVDELSGEYAKAYYETLLKEATTFYFRLCYPNDALPSCILHAPRAPLKVFQDTVGLLLPGNIERPKDGDYERLSGEWKDRYRMLPVDGETKRYLLSRGFTLQRNSERPIAVTMPNGEKKTVTAETDGVDDYLLTDGDARCLVYVSQHEGALAVRRDAYEKLLPSIGKYLKADAKYGEIGQPLEKMTAEERRELYSKLRHFSGGDHIQGGVCEAGSPRPYYRYIWEEDFDEYKDSDLIRYLTKEFRESTSLDPYSRLKLFERDVYFLLDVFESLYYHEICDLI